MIFNRLRAVMATVAAVAGMTVMAAPADTLTLSLDTCIAIALSDNPTIRVADMEIQRMDYSKKEVIGQLLPTVNFGGTYNRTLAKQTMYMNMSRAGAGAGDDAGDETPATGGRQGIKVGLDNSYTVGFSASVPLIAPQLWKSLKLSDAQILQSVEAARRSRIETVNQVKNAYYALLLAADSYRTIQESMDMAKFTADLYEKQYKLGAASEYDVLRTQVAVKNVEPELTQAQIAIRQAALQLTILMGLDASVTVRANTSLAAYERDMYDDVMQLTAKSENIDNNAELRLLDIQGEQLRRQMDVQKMAFMPTLALQTNYNWTSMSNGTPFKHFMWTPYSTIGLTLQVPLFEGLQRVRRVQQTRVQRQELELQRTNLVRSINMQTELALDNIQLNIKQINSCAESMRQAEKAHDIQQKSFEIGATTYLNLRDSELALTQSRLAYYQSIYNYLVAHSDLELLLGNAPLEKYGYNSLQKR